jgi:hypothetical protein
LRIGIHAACEQEYCKGGNFEPCGVHMGEIELDDVI